MKPLELDDTLKRLLLKIARDYRKNRDSPASR